VASGFWEGGEGFSVEFVTAVVQKLRIGWRGDMQVGEVVKVQIILDLCLHFEIVLRIKSRDRVIPTPIPLLQIDPTMPRYRALSRHLTSQL